MGISNLLSAIGIQTYNNNLNLPAGALSVADNVNINRLGVIENRRGFKQYGQIPGVTTQYASQIMPYRDRLIVHTPDSKLSWDSNGNGLLASLAGNFAAPSSDELRMKYVELNGNLYFTTSTGIKKISASDASQIGTTPITDTGAVRALDLQASLNLTQNGFLSANSQVGYRVIWGYTDNNNNQILGYPSPMVIVQNPSSNSAVADLVINKPQGIDSSLKYFFQVYRTSVYNIAVSPEDELKQVYEGFDDGSITFPFTFTDIYSESLRVANTNLYTNAISGEGIANGNLRPPIAKDTTIFKNSVFLGNIKTDQTLDNTLLGDSGFKDMKSLPETTTGISSEITVGVSTVNLHIPTHGFITSPFPIVLAGTLTLDGFHIATVIDSNNITIPKPSGATNGVITGGAELYYNYIKIDKNATENRYWAVGRRAENKIAITTANATGSTTVLKANISTDGIFNATAHGFLEGTSVLFSSLDTHFGSISVRYYLVNVTDNTFQISLTRGGSAINPGTASSTDATFTHYTLPYTLNHTYITMYSADNKVKYFLWFSHDGSTTLPISLTVPSAGSAVIPLNIQYKETYQEIIQVVYNTIFELNDFDISLDTNLTYVTVQTITSGSVTAYSSSLGSPTLIVTLEKQGIGLVGRSNLNNDCYFLLSTQSSAGVKNEEMTQSLLKAINNNPYEVVYGYYSSTFNGLPGEFSLESRDLDLIPFTISSNSSNISKAFNKLLPQTSTSEEIPNRVMFSKTNQPDSTPLANYIDIGPKNKPIRRIVGLRDSLFIFKDEGVYRLYGTDSTNFSVVLFDSSSNIASPDSAVVVNNQIYLLTTQGVARVSETGVQIISRPIEDQFLQITLNPDYKKLCFGVSYEADRSYLLFVPVKENDTTTTKAYRYNTFTESWTTWSRTYNCGVVLNDKLYFGATVDNYIEVERKNLNRTDFSDRTIIGKQIININGTNLLLSSVSGLKVGDAVVQNQTVTIALVNQLVMKLQKDPLVQLSNSYTLAKSGDNLATYLQTLNGSLTTFVSVVVTGVNTFSALHTDFNALTAALNASSTVFYADYRTLASGYTVTIEAHITNINNISNTVETDKETSFIIGETNVDQGINATIVYAPQHFGDPTVWKQVRESRLMFENTNFESAIVGFNTDLDNVFEDITFSMDGDGSFGNSNFGNNVFGGMGNQIPFRTLIPKNKQRNRFIRTRFKHINARNYFSLYGIAYEYNATSSKGSK